MRMYLTRLLSLVVGACALAFVATSSLAGTGPRYEQGSPTAQGQHPRAVLPSGSKPYGYSLEAMARIVAPFNVSDRSGTVVPLPNTPFQLLYSSANMPDPFRVGQRRILYVPVIYNDDSLPIIGNFPGNVENRGELLKYWYSQREFGIVYVEIVVDGEVYPLRAPYVVGLEFDSALPDGAKRYMTAAAFVGPLAPGAHTVEIRARATGDALREDPFPQFFPDGVFEFSLVYNVVVY
jgi:hypothetical protein